MRAYKVVNEDKYHDAKAFLKELKKLRKQNLKTIQETITPFKWSKYLGNDGGFNLLPTYIGFLPKEELSEIPEGWRKDKEHPKMLVPSKRTKKGKEIANKLDELPNYQFLKIEQVLDVGLTVNGRYTIPSLRLSKNKKHVLLICDDKIKLKEQDFKEITISKLYKLLGINN